MMRSHAWRRCAALALIAQPLSLSACGILGPQACTRELGWSVSPTEATLQVGDAFTATAEGLTCGGREHLAVDMSWSSSDTDVLVIGQKSGLAVAVSVGEVVVTGVDHGPYGIPDVAIPVHVLP
jgi:hypothetical protein